jgi:lysozyme family protein
MMGLERALAVVREHEGDAFTNDPADPGGATKYGISLRFLRSLGHELGDVDGDGDVDATDVRTLTWDQAAEIYRREFWDRWGYERLPETVAVKVFDLSVNVGPGQAHRLLQRALRAAGSPVKEDGVLGPVTRSACFSALSGGLLAALRSEAAGFYRLLVESRPDLARFILGWLSRAYS